MEIKIYQKEMELKLFELLKSEGEDWGDYTSESGRTQYNKAIESSIVYICLEEDDLIAYIRCKDDSGFGVYVYDLLVRQDKRGNQIGKKLIEYVKDEYKNQSIYIMSDVDPYYEKCGYKKIGSIFEV